MVDSNYARAYTEILEIISHFPPEEYNKIPSEKIDFFKDNMDKEYVFKIDPNIDLGKHVVSIEKAKILNKDEINEYISDNDLEDIIHVTLVIEDLENEEIILDFSDSD